MANDVKKYSLYLIAIVAIVAVVGIVVMTTNYGGFSGFSGSTSEDVLTSDGEYIGTSESVGLAGQAYSVKGCTDPDASSNAFNINQLLTASTVTSKYGSKADKCEVKTVKGKKVTYLQEGLCTITGKSTYLQKDCSVVFGSAYKCVNGACVDTTPKPTLTENCADGIDNDADTKIDCQDTDCSGKTNAKGFVCCKNANEIGCPAETKCDGGGYDESYQCLGCLFGEWDCPSGKECKEGACIAKTCTPGLTGQSKCVKDQWNSLSYKQEYQNADCTSTWNIIDWCIYGSNCVDNVGCCKDKLVPNSAICQGNVAYNQTKNSCTGELKDNYKDCTQNIDVVGKPNVCKQTSEQTSEQTSNNIGCFVDCQEEDVVYKCEQNWYADGKPYQYHKYLCKVNYNNYNEWNGWAYYYNPSAMGDKSNLNYIETCPVGATCYNPEGKCA